jgi:hypothetical protein
VHIDAPPVRPIGSVRSSGSNVVPVSPRSVGAGRLASRVLLQIGHEPRDRQRKQVAAREKRAELLRDE